MSLLVVLAVLCHQHPRYLNLPSVLPHLVHRKTTSSPPWAASRSNSLPQCLVSRLVSWEPRVPSSDPLLTSRKASWEPNWEFLVESRMPSSILPRESSDQLLVSRDQSCWL